MGFAATAGLGAVAGFTIFLGLPVARSRPSQSRIAMLNAASVGVLLFLFFDIVKNATEQVDTALAENRARGIGYGLLLAAGLAVGLLSLVVFERAGAAPAQAAAPQRPGALAAATAPPRPRPGAARAARPGGAGRPLHRRRASASTTSPRGWRSARRRTPAATSRTCSGCW